MKKLSKLPFVSKVKTFLKNKNGSETIEFIYSAALCCVLIMSCLLILSYTVQSNAIHHAGKRIARSIEIGGTARQEEIEALVTELIPNHTDLNVTCTVTPINPTTWYSATNRSLQLRQKFVVVIDADYKITVAESTNTGYQLTLPIHFEIDGQSEMFWK